MEKFLDKDSLEKLKKILSEVWQKQQYQDETVKEILDILKINGKNDAKDHICHILNALGKITIDEAIEEIKDYLENLQEGR